MDTESLAAKYRRILESQVEKPRKANRRAAAELGRELLLADTPIEKIGDIHLTALDQLLAAGSDDREVRKARVLCTLLVETLTAYGSAFREQAAIRKRAEEQAKQHLADLAYVTRVGVMAEIAPGLAHELNQPLAAIVNYADACVAMVRSGSDSADLIPELEKVSAQARRAGEIMRRLRDFVRKRKLSDSTVAINDLVRKVMDLVGGGVRSSGLSLDVEASDDLPLLRCDSIQIQQVIINLIQNAREALRATPRGARRITIRTAQAADGMVEIAVSDTGPGFSAEVAKRMFEPFFTTKTDSMGLGLSISRSIVEAHGGLLSATPNADQGVTLRVRLPVNRERNKIER